MLKYSLVKNIYYLPQLQTCTSPLTLKHKKNVEEKAIYFANRK